MLTEKDNCIDSKMARFECAILLVILHSASAHRDFDIPWHTHFHEHGLYRAFFGGFFSTMFLICAVIAFYYFCVRDGTFRRSFPLFPRKPIIPITIPFARSANYVDSVSPETFVLTSATTAPSVFYANKPHHSTVVGPWTDPNSVTTKTGAYPGYNAV